MVVFPLALLAVALKLLHQHEVFGKGKEDLQFWFLGFRGLGCRGFRGLGFRVLGLASEPQAISQSTV